MTEKPVKNKKSEYFMIKSSYNNTFPHEKSGKVRVRI